MINQWCSQRPKSFRKFIVQPFQLRRAKRRGVGSLEDCESSRHAILGDACGKGNKLEAAANNQHDESVMLGSRKPRKAFFLSTQAQSLRELLVGSIV